jgi:hypothetical protein
MRREELLALLLHSQNSLETETKEASARLRKLQLSEESSADRPIMNHPEHRFSGGSLTGSIVFSEVL